MKLKEIKMSIDNKTNEIGELVNKRNSCLTNTYRIEYGKDIVEDDKYLVNAPHEYKVDELTEEIDRINNIVLKLRELLYDANDNTMIEFKGEKIRLSTAIFKLKQLKDKKPSIKKLSDVKEYRNIISPTRYSEDIKTYVDVTKPTFDSSKYRDIAKEIEKDIMTLQSAIDKANTDTDLEINFTL